MSLLILHCSSDAVSPPARGESFLGETPDGEAARVDEADDQLFTADTLEEAESGEPPPACIEVNVEFERVTPNVVLLIDQSNSMVVPLPDGTAVPRSRWDALRDALVHPDEGVVTRLSEHVRFGLALYTAENSASCPEVTSVDVAIGNFDEIVAGYPDLAELQNGPERMHHTPTSESLNQVAASLASLEVDGPRVIVLATDGNPDNCTDPDDNNLNDGALSKELVLDAVEEAWLDGIRTFVVSVGDEIGEEHLQAVASAGAGGAAEAEFYQALEPQTLLEAFESILGTVITCDFTLNGTVRPELANSGTVTLDGQELNFGEADGWSMPEEDVVTLNGTACDAVTREARRIAIEFPCETFVVR